MNATTTTTSGPAALPDHLTSAMTATAKGADKARSLSRRMASLMDRVHLAGTDTASKRRSDAGKAKPLGITAARPIPGTIFANLDGRNVAIVPLTGQLGRGKAMKMDLVDWTRLAARLEDGRRVAVTKSRAMTGSVDLYVDGVAAMTWANSSNRKHRVALARFITETRDPLVQVRVRNGDPLDMRRANLVLSSKGAIASSKSWREVDWRMVDAIAAGAATASA